MTDPVSIPPSPAHAAEVHAKKAWQRPALARIDSSRAELGANDANPEGEFGFGS